MLKVTHLPKGVREDPLPPSHGHGTRGTAISLQAGPHSGFPPAALSLSLCCGPEALG